MACPPQSALCPPFVAAYNQHPKMLWSSSYAYTYGNLGRCGNSHCLRPSPGRRAPGLRCRFRAVSTAARRHHHYTGGAELQNALTAVAVEVFREHPLLYAATIPVGAARLLVKVSGGLFWPGAAWNVALLGLAAAGMWRLTLARRWLDGLFLLLPCAYFVLGTLLVFTSGIDTRARVMVTPLLAVMAAQGVMWWLERRR